MTSKDFQKARAFLMNISKKDKVAIIHHDDADGFCSGILFYDHCISRGAKVKTFPYNYSKTKIKDLKLKSFNKIIITDVATEVMNGSIESIKDKEVLYTDHHPKFPLPKEMLSLITADQGYIPSSRTTYELVGGKKWLSLIGTISDAGDFYKENNKFIKNFLTESKISLEEFKQNYVYPLSNTIIYFKKNPRKLFKKLSKISSLNEIKKLEKYSNKIEKEISKKIKEYHRKKEIFGNIRLFKYKSKLHVSKPLINIISKNNTKNIYIFLAPSKKIINISSRHQNGKANLPKLLKELTKGFESSEVGGHKRASGGHFLAKDLEKFKLRIKDYLKK